MTEQQALDLLRKGAAEGTRQDFARELGISPQYLSDVLRGQCDPHRVLERFGLRRVVSYERVKA